MPDPTKIDEAAPSLPAKQNPLFYQRLVENTLDALIVLDAEGRVRYESPAPLHGLGFEPGAGMGRSVFDLVHPDDLPDVLACFERIGKVPGADEQIQAWLRPREGRWRCMEMHLRNLLDDPAVRGVLIHLHDVTDRLVARQALQRSYSDLHKHVESYTAALRLTNERLRREVDERKRAEVELKESEALYRSVAANAPVILFALDADGVFTLSEGQALQRLGLQPNEVVGTSAFDLYAGHPVIEANLRAVLRGETRSWAAKVGDAFFQTVAAPVFDEEGGVEGVIGVSTDVTVRVEMEERLRESELQFRRTFEQAAVGIAHVGPEGQFLRLNERYCEMVGYSVEEMQTLTFQDITHPEDLDTDLAYVRQVLAGELPFYSMQKRYVHKQGHSVWVRLTVSLVRTAEGKPKYFIAVAEDITTRKQTEEALRKSEAKAAAVLDTTAEGIVTINARGYIQSFNKAAERLFGYRADEVIGQRINMLMPSPYREEHDGYLQRYLHTGQPHIIGIGRDVEGRCKDGSVFPMYLSVSEVMLDEERLFTGIVHDLTARVRAEAATRQHARQQAAVADLGQAAWAYRNDLKGFLDLVVTTVAETLDADLCKVLRLLPDGEHLVLRAGIGWRKGLVGRATVGTGLNSQAGYTLRTEGPVLVDDLRTETRFNGPPLLVDHGVVSGLSVVIQGEDEPYGVLGVHTRRHHPFSEDDAHFVQAVANLVGEAIQRHRYTTLLEERVQARTAQLEAANEELESFSYSVSHDLRSPLRAMEGFTNILMDRHLDELSEQAQHYLRRVRVNTQRMGALIDDLLQFSRLSRRELTRRSVEPEKLVRAVWEELEHERKGRPVNFEVQPLPACQADPSLLKQVFANLIGNALKFTKHRDPAVIKVGARAEADPVVYYVSDNGTGFDMRYADKLFGIFQRLHRAEEYEGTGVGLATVQRVVHRHQGRIWAEAEPDKGATFFFTLTSTAPATSHNDE